MCFNKKPSEIIALTSSQALFTCQGSPKTRLTCFQSIKTSQRNNSSHMKEQKCGVGGKDDGMWLDIAGRTGL